jgi:hypothetical protein
LEEAWVDARVGALIRPNKTLAPANGPARLVLERQTGLNLTSPFGGPI